MNDKQASIGLGLVLLLMISSGAPIWVQLPILALMGVWIVLTASNRSE